MRRSTGDAAEYRESRRSTGNGAERGRAVHEPGSRSPEPGCRAAPARPGARPRSPGSGSGSRASGYGYGYGYGCSNTGSSSGRWPSEARATDCRSSLTGPYSVVRGRAGRPASSAMATRSWTERYEP